ncbi:MAG: hypothetical protein HKP14_05630 [Bacteroidia bacterium]|nr:hypothetical protein [Bacteroidia bacterium]
MKQYFFILLVFLASCAPTKLSNKSAGEQLVIETQSFDKPLTYMEVAKNFEGNETRSIISAELLLKGIDFAFDGIKSAIKKGAERYYQEYAVSLYNNTFYSQNSTLGTLDPENIKFKGFVITRSVELEDGRDVALTASFSMDESKYIDIYTQSKFYLKCDSININYSKVKMNAKKWFTPWTWFMKVQEKINLDLEMDILANWIDESGSIHKQESFGKFFFPIRDFTVGNKDTTYTNIPIGGYCYLPPRSAAFCMSSRGQWEKCYGQGDFDIIAKITESSKNNKLNKVIFDNISILEEVDAQPIKDLLNK